MRLHDKKFFELYAKLIGYIPEERELLWKSFSTTQLDFINLLADLCYEQGYEACEEDKIV